MEKVKLGDVCEIINGYAFKSNLYEENGIRIIRITNVQKGYIEDTEPKFYNLNLKRKLNKYMLYEKDLLISLTGNVGRVGILKKEMLPAALNQRVGCIRVLNKSRLDKNYLFNVLNNKLFENECINNSKGIAQKNLSTEWLKEYEINLPSLEEQKNIANKLDKVQKIIDIRKKQIEELDKLIKSQFVKMFENKEFPYVEFKEYMERCVDIGSNGANSIVMEHYNMTDTKDYAMVVRFINLNSGDFVNDVKYINKEDYEFYSKSKVYGDEIIFCKIGSAGMNYIMPKLNMPVTLGLNQIMITPKNINTRYLYEYINSNEGKKYIKNNINGAVTKTITKHALWVFPIKTPPIELQNKFADIVKQIDKQKFEIQKNLEEMQKLQESLMNKYFGEY